jgi:hypothetical protein
MSETKRKRAKSQPVKKPPPRWRRYLVQAELELPAPTAATLARGRADQGDSTGSAQHLAPAAWWQSRLVVAALAASCGLALVVTGIAGYRAARDREQAQLAQESVRLLTLRASSSERDLRVTPNPRSWSAAPDLALPWPEPPQMFHLYFPMGYSDYPSFALTIDKVDHGRVLVLHRLAPDSNRDLRLSLNSSAFGPGEYRIRLQGYTWRGERKDVGWVRLVLTSPPGDS